MKTQTLQDVANWMKKTDLTTVSYRRGSDAMELSIDASAPQPDAAFPPCRLIPVSAHEVGIFWFQDIGKAKKIDKGVNVKKDQTLGFITTGKEKYTVSAPSAGRIISDILEDGQAVEYGQPLFFIQP